MDTYMYWYNGHGYDINVYTGYIAAILLLHQDHELSLLLMNTIQKVGRSWTDEHNW